MKTKVFIREFAYRLVCETVGAYANVADSYRRSIWVNMKTDREEIIISSLEAQRRDYRKKQSMRSAFMSFMSFAVFAAVIYMILSNSEGWNKVQKAFFDPYYFVQAIPTVFKGVLTNLKILFFAVIGVAFFGTLLAITRTTVSSVLFPLRLFAMLYTDLLRGTPMIIVLYLIGFGVPGLRIFGRIDASLLGTISIIVVYSAYASEVIRAGIEAVHPSQRAAARSLGFSHSQTMRLIVLPQAVRKVVPALMNEFVSMQKDVGLVSVLGAIDAVRSAQILVSLHYNFTPYVVTGAMFIIMSFPMIRLTDWYTNKLKKREQAGGVV